MKFEDLFPRSRPIIAVLHLPSLPGSHSWKGDLDALYQTTLHEAGIYATQGVDAIVLENFNDFPFFPDHVPASTVASMAALVREVVRQVSIPVGVNVLRNDATAALSIAAATGAKFIRVNVHSGAMVTDQGLIQGRAYETLRLRESLRAEVLIFADVHVKHAAPLAPRSIADETKDLVERGLADAVIVSGSGTGAEINPLDLKTTGEASRVPVLTGSGVNTRNLENYFPLADGFIVGSTFKIEGKAQNQVETAKVKAFMAEAARLRNLKV
jgi:uncharacterized protein